MKKIFIIAALPLIMACSTESVQDEETNPQLPQPTPEVTDTTKNDSTSSGKDVVVPVVTKTPGAIALSENERKLLYQCNLFALRLLRNVNSETNGSSFIISPMSVGYLLGMLNDGAKGKTQDELMQALGFGNSSAKSVNEYFGNMLVNAPTVDEKVDIASANALFANSSQGVAFAKPFAADMKGYYQAGIESLDFTQANTLDKINGWCNSSTKGLIPTILNNDEFNPNGMAYLLNSVYFKADWTTVFDKEETKQHDFTTADGQTVGMDMMHKQDDVLYWEDEVMKAVSLPYGKGAFRMVCMLPENGNTVSSLIDRLCEGLWQEYVKPETQLMTGVDILLPKFTTETSQNLVPILEKMGIATAFTTAADYGSMLESGNIYFDLMKQKARIEVSEEGTEAAAATIGGQCTIDEGDTDQEPQFPTFHATRPFVYIIMEANTGAIFFVGEFTGKD